MPYRTGEQHPLFDYSAIVDRTPLKWPDGKRLALWIVPNIEHLELYDAKGAANNRDTGRLDYGNRVGIWRLMEVLDRHGMRGTVALNSSVTRHYPRIIEECLKRKWELMGHGITNSQSMNELAPDDEAAVIKHAVEEIRTATGQPVRGWLGPGLRESPRTPDLLVANGVEYVADWVNDDRPYRFRNGLTSIPYTLDLNDTRMSRAPTVDPSDWRDMVKRAFDTLYAEGGHVMCLALHPYITGMPSRIGVFNEVLAYITGHADVWRTTGSEIIDAYKAQAP